MEAVGSAIDEVDIETWKLIIPSKCLRKAARRGDLRSVKLFLFRVIPQMWINDVNELGETALYIAAENGHPEVVKELLKYSDKETLTKRSHLDFDPLHIAASQGHHDIVKLLLDHDVSLCQTRSQGNVTPLITAASKGHAAVVQELLSKDPILLTIPKPDLRKALYLAARSGHIETVKILLEKDPQLAKMIYKRGQTALHVAVKGASSEVVKLLLSIPGMKVNALTNDQKTALDIAYMLPPSEKATDIRTCLVCHGVVRANQLNQPPAELIKDTMTKIRREVYRMDYEVLELYSFGVKDHEAIILGLLSAAVMLFLRLIMFSGRCVDRYIYVIYAVYVFTTLTLVLIHVMLEIRGEARAKRRKVGEVVIKLTWLVFVCILVAFMATSYIVIVRENEWDTYSATVFGGVIIMSVVLGIMLSYWHKRYRAWIFRMRGKRIAKHLEEIRKNVDKFKQAASKKDILDAC